MSEPGGDDLGPADAEAAERGRAIVAEARAIRRRMLDDAEHRRGALVAELERLRAAIDAAISALTAPDVGDSAKPEAAPSQTPSPASAATAPPPARPVPPVPHEDVPERATALFDALRAETPPPAPEPRPVRTPRAAPGPTRDEDGTVPDSTSKEGDDGAGSPDVATGVEPGPPRAPEPDSPADALRRRRDALIDPLVPEVVRVSKRLLQDEQNSLLDTARRARGRPEPGRLLPEPMRQRESWTALLAPAIDAAYLGGRAAAGKTGRVTSAPVRVVVELAALLVTPLRERLVTTMESVVAEGPYDSVNELQRALGSAIGARYREWRTVDLEEHVVDVLAAAYARGAYDAAAPAAMLQWIPAEPGRCPDCDDNALEPTLKGSAFPTGQQHPPAHPGCRCLIVPADG